MHGYYEDPPRNAQSNYESFSIKLVALPLLVLVALTGMVISHPAGVRWIADAVHGGFVGIDRTTGPIPEPERPGQLARPDTQVQPTKAF